jgi:hypothetical protein
VGVRQPAAQRANITVPASTGRPSIVMNVPTPNQKQTMHSTTVTRPSGKPNSTYCVSMPSWRRAPRRAWSGEVMSWTLGTAAISPHPAGQHVRGGVNPMPARFANFADFLPISANT